MIRTIKEFLQLAGNLTHIISCNEQIQNSYLLASEFIIQLIVSLHYTTSKDNLKNKLIELKQ